MDRELTPDELEALRDAQIVDVRTDEERAAGRIPETRHVPFERLREAAAELDRERPLVFYCRGGDRSLAAAEAFAASGYDARSLAGGIVAWREAGRPVEGEIAAPSGLPPR